MVRKESCRWVALTCELQIKKGLDYIAIFVQSYLNWELKINCHSKIFKQDAFHDTLRITTT